MTEPIISVSGLRGIVGRGLDPLVAIRYACAFAGQLPPGPIILTRDGRSTGYVFAQALRAGLSAVGRDVLDAQVAATPTTGILVRASRAAGGIQISASHNPPEYNGLKLFDGAGRVVPADFGERVLSSYRDQGPNWASWDRLGNASACRGDPAEEHWRLIAPIVDVERIRRRGFRVLLDANHGAGSLLGAKLLQELGCVVDILGPRPDGRFEHPPEPTEENLTAVATQVTATNADVGFCQDPDADRLAIVDETGRYIGEEFTLALCVDHVLRQRRGPIVTNCSTSRMSEDLARKYEAPFDRAKVGEANVVEAMLKSGAILGGEGNGGVIDPRVGLVRDSFVGMALVLDAMAARGKRVGELADELPHYAMVKAKTAFPLDRLDQGYAALRRSFADGQCTEPDGVRWDWPDGWLLVRPSNTEPLVRVICEASTKERAKALCETALETLTGVSR
jgi:phosphomannomutase